MLAALLLALASPAPVHADEPESDENELVARDAKGQVLGGCPLRHTEVRAEIAGFVARTVVVQTFDNPFEMPIEALYTFPLPERGAVDGLWIRSGERRIRAEIRRREEARDVYERARAGGQLAALLDQERPNVFSQSIANLAPGQAVEIEIHYVAPLEYEAGSFEFVFPTVVGPRFIPESARVPDAVQISPPIVPEGMRSGHDISISLEIDAGVPIRSLSSPLHQIDVERPASTRARVRLAERAAIPNRDFVLRYEVAGDRVQSGYLVHRDASGDGYLTLVLLPPARVTRADIAPRELVFVIDRSGSQRGLPLEKARETVLWMLEHLNPNDTFQLVSFSNRSEMLFEEPQQVTRASLSKARSYVERLDAQGGTMMADTVARICATPAPANRLRIVSFMTDGYVGDDHAVLHLVQTLRGTSRWFPFGTGNSVNRYLLEGMAKQGGGEVEYVLLNDPGERVARKFHERIAQPLLTDVSLEVEGIDVVDVLPSRHADVWAEKPLLIHARYRRTGRGHVTLRGYRAGKPYEQRLEVELPDRRSGNAAIASLWARARVESLEAKDLAGLQRGAFDPALRDEVVSVALAHRLVTPFTSFVAVDEGSKVQGSAVQVPVPVEMPQGVQYEGIFGSPSAGSQTSARMYLRSRVATDAVVGNLAGAPRDADAAGERESAPSSARTQEPPKAPSAPFAGAEKLDDALRTLARIPDLPSRVQPSALLRVRIEASALSDDVLRQLREAGFALETLDIRGPNAIGRVAPRDLKKLAALNAVKRIALVAQ